MTWVEYVQSHLMCDISDLPGYENDQAMRGKHLTAAAILGQNGVMWAQSLNFPVIDADEIGAIFVELEEPGDMTRAYIGGRKYKKDVGGIDGQVITLKRGSSGVVIKKTMLALVIGMYDAPVTRAICSNIVARLANFMVTHLHN